MLTQRLRRSTIRKLRYLRLMQPIRRSLLDVSFSSSQSMQMAIRYLRQTAAYLKSGHHQIQRFIHLSLQLVTTLSKSSLLQRDTRSVRTFTSSDLALTIREMLRLQHLQDLASTMKPKTESNSTMIQSRLRLRLVV